MALYCADNRRQYAILHIYIYILDYTGIYYGIPSSKYSGIRSGISIFRHSILVYVVAFYLAHFLAL